MGGFWRTVHIPLPFKQNIGEHRSCHHPSNNTWARTNHASAPQPKHGRDPTMPLPPNQNVMDNNRTLALQTGIATAPCLPVKQEYMSSCSAEEARRPIRTRGHIFVLSTEGLLLLCRGACLLHLPVPRLIFFLLLLLFLFLLLLIVALPHSRALIRIIAVSMFSCSSR